MAFFCLLKISWRKVLTESAIPKSEYPKFLKILTNHIKENQSNNIRSGFKKCGIIPFNRESVLNCLPPETIQNDNEDSRVLNDSLISILKEMRCLNDTTKPKQKRQRLDIELGKSIGNREISSSDEDAQRQMENIDDPAEVIIKNLGGKNNTLEKIDSLTNGHESNQNCIILNDFDKNRIFTNAAFTFGEYSDEELVSLLGQK